MRLLAIVVGSTVSIGWIVATAQGAISYLNHFERDRMCDLLALQSYSFCSGVATWWLLFLSGIAMSFALGFLLVRAIEDLVKGSLR